VVFTTLERLFEPTVMFFGLMIVIESEENHDELVEKILRRREENDLYIKLEKWTF